ncbi:MAG: DUF433 domain-containing protein [Spirochaetaceae bacterium]|nr:DUF433 domain-containing protein [Spirochaetaceae bacterium]
MSEAGDGSVELGRVVSRNPEIHSGDLVFAATRVPVETLVDYLRSDHSIDEFLRDFPTVERWQVESYLEISTDGVDILRALTVIE